MPCAHAAASWLSPRAPLLDIMASTSGNSWIHGGGGFGERHGKHDLTRSMASTSTEQG